MFLFKWNAHTSAKERNWAPTAGKTTEEGGPSDNCSPPRNRAPHRDKNSPNSHPSATGRKRCKGTSDGTGSHVCSLSPHDWGMEDRACCLLAGCGEESYRGSVRAGITGSGLSSRPEEADSLTGTWWLAQVSAQIRAQGVLQACPFFPRPERAENG